MKIRTPIVLLSAVGLIPMAASAQQAPTPADQATAARANAEQDRQAQQQRGAHVWDSMPSYADRKREGAQKNADRATDPTLKAQYQQEADSWAEGGDNRVALHIAGGALTGGLTGGGLGAAGGAAGAGVSAKLAP